MINAVDVVIRIVVQVMVFQKQITARNNAYVAIKVASDRHSTGVVVPSLQFLGYFQDHAVMATNVAVDADDPEWLKVTDDERILIPDYEVMLAQPAVVDVLVVVPGVPVVGVVARRNFSSA